MSLVDGSFSLNSRFTSPGVLVLFANILAPNKPGNDKGVRTCGKPLPLELAHGELALQV
jgi:hypothetical protein